MTVNNLAEREEAVRLFEASRAAEQAYDDHPLTLQIDDYGYGDVKRCAKSGVPLLNDDETVEDLSTGEVYLRSALGLPARPETVSDETEEEEGVELEIVEA